MHFYIMLTLADFMNSKQNPKSSKNLKKLVVSDLILIIALTQFLNKYYFLLVIKVTILGTTPNKNGHRVRFYEANPGEANQKKIFFVNELVFRIIVHELKWNLCNVLNTFNFFYRTGSISHLDVVSAEEREAAIIASTKQRNTIRISRRLK